MQLFDARQNLFGIFELAALDFAMRLAEQEIGILLRERFLHRGRRGGTKALPSGVAARKLCAAHTNVN